MILASVWIYKGLLNMQVRLYTSVDYAEISLYILCVNVW